MTPEAKLIKITDAMVDAVARHGGYLTGSAIRSAWFAGVAAAGGDETERTLRREIDRQTDEIQILRLKIQEMHDENMKLRLALIRLRDWAWVITPADRMAGVRAIAREALK